ncbi:dethiobiotin synthase [Marinobacterium sediminicola]|uniref:ATP-dependent dethiobiotin synthetase BioD n=1 Tax=Marinobacterium sediminicola TaxID=518898 RepID=A0ABY1S0B0_9GAMM|nr:dethiobiotin synthase [Marinobacterium sediminicola]ULG70005.1 dethiobiotin synthase [Marinobacterium sediminicola]SMR74459.1 dethiobiotin synthetase [Marinobacterium sediminicola]
MKKRFFIAGTDTDAGKTLVTTGLLAAANRQGLRTMGLKPVAAGCEQTPDGLRNSDALQLQQTASVKLSYEQVNPIAFEPPIAPHIAAEQEGRALSADRLAAYCRGAMMQPADLVLVEGAGGWRVPLSMRESLARLPQLLELDVILVVGMKLGCINHAILTAEAIARDGLRLAGWVANHIDPAMSCPDENLATLERLFRAPLLGRVPWLEAPTADAVADHLDLRLLLGE